MEELVSSEVNQVGGGDYYHWQEVLAATGGVLMAIGAFNPELGGVPFLIGAGLVLGSAYLHPD